MFDPEKTPARSSGVLTKFSYVLHIKTYNKDSTNSLPFILKNKVSNEQLNDEKNCFLLSTLTFFFN